jgi:hypothetical protein
MRSFFTAATVLLFATPMSADDKPTPNTLSAKEVAEGWLLLFDGETTFGWKAMRPADPRYSEFTAKDGVLILEGKNGGYAEMNCTSRFRHFEAVGEYRVSGKLASPRADFNLSLLHTEPSVGNAMSFELPATDEWKSFSVRIAPDGRKVTVAGKVVTDWKPPAGPDADRFVPVKLLASHIKIWVPERGDCRLELRNFKLRPLDATPLFTGKTLEGWKVNAADPKRMASRFEVTADGDLSVKNGPGDLVTEKEFANFVLQLECKTLGNGLNSGIFFRCIPGQYQNGYEAQIQNAFLDNDRTKPKDYGTGAIYRRVAARKVVSNDNEWFTMTVVADGRHFATWVNGYQTVDWTDDRKEHDNARQGFRAAKGPISIQGHDPTTDLLFRNIRITELPAEKK